MLLKKVLRMCWYENNSAPGYAQALVDTETQIFPWQAFQMMGKPIFILTAIVET